MLLSFYSPVGWVYHKQINEQFVKVGIIFLTDFNSPALKKVLHITSRFGGE